LINLHPESNLKENIITLGAELIDCLLYIDRKNVTVDDLFIKFIRKTNLKDFNLFIETLTFLFSLDIVGIEGYKIKLLKNDNN